MIGTRGNPSCQGKLSYRGPVSPRSGGLPRIKLDLTADERLVLPPVRIPIFHPYGDAPEEGIEVLSYAYEEAFGEKVRALAERTRPRDLYDVINLYRNTDARPSASVLLDVLTQKCEFKGIPVPKDGDLDEHKNDLEGAWGRCWRINSQVCRLSKLSGMLCRNFSPGWKAVCPRKYLRPIN